MPLFTDIKFVVQMMTGIGVRECEHVSEMNQVESSIHECVDCKEAGTRWVHLRMCMTCGYVGCCDSSPLTHMRAHVESTGHPIARSIEGKESWLWCYPHERLIRRKM
jgi:uncharacterized UBP type Zn finger protein